MHERAPPSFAAILSPECQRPVVTVINRLGWGLLTILSLQSLPRDS
jgi:hypothetical protein